MRKWLKDNTLKIKINYLLEVYTNVSRVPLYLF